MSINCSFNKSSISYTMKVWVRRRICMTYFEKRKKDSCKIDSGAIKLCRGWKCTFLGNITLFHQFSMSSIALLCNINVDWDMKQQKSESHRKAIDRIARNVHCLPRWTMSTQNMWEIPQSSLWPWKFSFFDLLEQRISKFNLIVDPRESCDESSGSVVSHMLHIYTRRRLLLAAAL